MAILQSVPGLSVSVLIDDKDVDEYEDDEEVETPDGHVAECQAAHTVRKYIEAISDKEFSIQFALNRDYNMDSQSLILRIDIDGKGMISPVVSRANSPAYFTGSKVIQPYKCTTRGAQVDCPGNSRKQLLKKFKFRRLRQNDAKYVDELGEISMFIYRGSRTSQAKAQPSAAKELKEQIKVHEKALKGQAKSHSTLLVPSSELTTKSHVNVTEINGHDFPLAIFRFKYRSRAALKSLLVLARSPSPEPEPEPAIDLNNLDQDQRAQVEAFLRGLSDKKNRSSNTPTRAIKRERTDNGDGEGSRKKRKSQAKITVDLTGDSDGGD